MSLNSDRKAKKNQESRELDELQTTFQEEFTDLEKNIPCSIFTFFLLLKNVLDLLKHLNPLWPTFRLNNATHLQSLKP